MSDTTAPNGAPPSAERWVIFEAVGHIKVAGRYYVENGLHRVDIPDPSDPNLYRTEWYGTAAIFRITPVDELTARREAASCVIPAAISWDVRRQLKQLVAPQETIEQMSFETDVPVEEYGYGDQESDD